MAEEFPMPEEGQKAPKFSGMDQRGKAVSLDDFRDQLLVLYFYPKDDTPGCTKQACNLRDGQSELRSRGVAVVGVSADSTTSHEKFADKYDLPFPLIADTDKSIMKRYGAYGKKNRYGRIFVGVKRTTFLIDRDGTILHVFKRPNTRDHTREILDKLPG